MVKVAERGRESANGREVGAAPGSRSLQIASEGLRTTQDFKDMGAALAEDILTGLLSHKVAGPVVRSLTMVIRVAEYEQKNSNGHAADLADSRRPRTEAPSDSLSKREAELLEELAAIRKERAAK